MTLPWSRYLHKNLTSLLFILPEPITYCPPPIYAGHSHHPSRSSTCSNHHLDQMGKLHSPKQPSWIIGKLVFHPRTFYSNHMSIWIKNPPTSSVMHPRPTAATVNYKGQHNFQAHEIQNMSWDILLCNIKNLILSIEPWGKHQKATYVPPTHHKHLH